MVWKLALKGLEYGIQEAEIRCFSFIPQTGLKFVLVGILFVSFETVDIDVKLGIFDPPTSIHHQDKIGWHSGRDLNGSTSLNLSNPDDVRFTCRCRPGESAGVRSEEHTS